MQETQEAQVQFLSQEDPLEEPTPVFLPGGSPGQRRLAGYSPWGHKESDMSEQLSTHTGTGKLARETSRDRETQ